MGTENVPEPTLNVCTKGAALGGGDKGAANDQVMEGTSLYWCKAGVLHRTTGQQTSGSTLKTSDVVVEGGCSGSLRYVLQVAAGASKPGATSGTQSFADVAHVRPLPTEDACSKPTVRGTPGNDVIVLYNSTDNIVDAGDGNDVVVSLGTGNDVLCGGAGDDVLIGGHGSDSLFGGGGSNVLVGGPNDGAQDYLDAGSSAVGTCSPGDDPGDLLFAGTGCDANLEVPASSPSTAGHGGTTRRAVVTTTAPTSRPTSRTTTTSATTTGVGSTTTKPPSTTTTTHPAG
jgi:Ca2+-binding RTX toxin-like protein